ncbi:MAG TPA: hypothetical protein VK168_14550 [Saprospiraceae bacterium]|nr:hypothetical protein [Saprospiraceae bacterium]
MANSPVFDTIRQYISEGETGKALQTFIGHLESEHTHSQLLKALRIAQGNFHTVQRKEGNGILNFQEARSEYARINEVMLNMLDEIRSNPSGSNTSAKPLVRVWIATAGLLVGLVVLAIYFLLPNSGKVASTPGLQCPEFKFGVRKVMVLPFQKLGGEDSRPDLSLQTRIQDLTERNQLATEVKLVTADKPELIKPGSAREGAALGIACEADLVIWGEYEKFADSISVDIRYAFTAADWPAGIASQTFKNVSEIKTDQMKISNFDEAVLRLCTALALHANRMDLAEKWLMKQPNANAREQAWKQQLQDARK